MQKTFFYNTALILALGCLAWPSIAQEDPNWFHKDFKEDKVYGLSTDKAYAEIIKERKPKEKITVAIIDSGVETDHEDLKGNIWTNADEIPGNGKDDDGNGYVDDVHGWNFLVSSTGEDINYETLEVTRLLRHYEQLKNERPLTEAEQQNFELTQEDYDKQMKEYASLAPIKPAFEKMDSAIVSVLGKEDFTMKEVRAIESSDPLVEKAKKFYFLINLSGAKRSDMLDLVEHVDKLSKYYLNKGFDPRGPVDLSNRYYGNNHYEGEHAMHGTHVSGIIGAERNNGKGINGIAPESVELMVLRAVPDGDERDVDIANAIYYAVDNGAKIINMSFGKSFSPNKDMVDEAIQYAASKGVLIVHAAGNDSENVDENRNFPSERSNEGVAAQNMITVGASTVEKNKKLPASLSNYGKGTVDIFAPGVDINSTVPDNKYEEASGTSMAAPMVSGVAALVWSYYPELTMAELKEVVLESSVKLPRKKVLLPRVEGKKEKVRFSELSSTAGLLNAYRALQYAEQKVATKNN